MPKIPTFQQPGQQLQARPAFEDPRAARQKGEAFGRFAGAAAGAANAAVEFQRVAKKARLRNAVDTAEEGALTDDREARMFAEKNAKADGSDLESLYADRIEQVSQEKLKGIEDEEERRAVAGLYNNVRQRSAEKLFSRSRTMFVNETTRQAEQKRNMRASTVFVDPSLLQEKLDRVDDDFSRDVEAGIFNENQRSKVVAADKSAYVQAALNSLINDGNVKNLGSARELLEKNAGFLKPGQAGNYLNLISSKQLKAQRDRLDDEDRLTKQQEKQMKDQQEANARRYLLDLKKAREDGFPAQEQREFQERLDKLLEEEGIPMGGPGGFYKLQDELTPGEAEIQSEISADLNNKIDRATSTFQLEKIRTNILANGKNLSLEEHDRLLQDVEQRKNQLNNTDLGYKAEDESAKNLINAATQSDAMIKLMKGAAKAKASVRKATILSLFRKHKSRGLRPMEAADKAIDEMGIIAGDEKLGHIKSVALGDQDDLSDFTGRKGKALKKKLKKLFPKKSEYIEQLILLERKRQRLLYLKRVDRSIKLNSALGQPGK